MKGNLPDIGQNGYAGYKIQKWANNVEGNDNSEDKDLDDLDEILEESLIDVSEDEKLMLKWKLKDVQQQINDEYVPYIEELEGENDKDPFEDEDEEDGRLSCEARDEIY